MSSSSNSAERKLWIASVICLIFMIIEVVGGLWADSLAIMTDAAHLFSDLSSFAISLFALWISKRSGSQSHSFGYYRAEILGAMSSVLMIWILTVVLCYKAAMRLIRPEPINGPVMLVTAVFGLFANVMMMSVLGLHSHHGQECNHSHGASASHSHGSHSHGHSEGGSHNHNDNNEVNRVAVRPQDLEGGECSVVCRSTCQATCSKMPNYTSDEASLAEPLLAETSCCSKTVNRNKGKAKEQTCCGHRDSGGALPAPTESDAENEKEHENMNLRAAYIHALGDLIQNIGVAIAAILIYYNPKWVFF
eukprot:Platyproteum_vivax@DN6459_c0_g1_i2.p1